MTNLANNPDNSPDEETSAGVFGLVGEQRPPGPSKVDGARVERAVRELLLAIGEDPDRDGLVATPRPGGQDV